MLTVFFLYLFPPVQKNYSSNHMLIRKIKKEKKSLDNKNFVGTVPMDLSNVFDCIPHGLLITKMHAYGFNIDSLEILFFSHLEGRKQNMRINNTYSVFQVLLSGFPLGRILGPIPFSIFINDLLFWIENAKLHNFADGNTISCTEKSIEEFIKSLT